MASASAGKGECGTVRISRITVPWPITKCNRPHVLSLLGLLRVIGGGVPESGMGEEGRMVVWRCTLRWKRTKVRA